MDELDNISLETLELMEETIFHKFDEVYSQHRKYDRDIPETVTAYEEALEAATRLREAKEEREEVNKEHLNKVVGKALDDASDGSKR